MYLSIVNSSIISSYFAFVNYVCDILLAYVFIAPIGCLAKDHITYCIRAASVGTVRLGSALLQDMKKISLNGNLFYDRSTKSRVVHRGGNLSGRFGSGSIMLDHFRFIWLGHSWDMTWSCFKSDFGPVVCGFYRVWFFFRLWIWFLLVRLQVIMSCRSFGFGRFGLDHL